jgi:hypothetical protein
MGYPSDGRRNRSHLLGRDCGLSDFKMIVPEDMRLQEGPFATRVVIGSKTLRGSGMDGSPQLVATVFIDGIAYRVIAPSEAIGESLDWLPHCQVRATVVDPLGGSAEVDAEPYLKLYAIKVAKEELERRQSGMSSSGGAGSAEPYFHVVAHTSKAPITEAKFDLRRDELEQRILAPYRDLRPIVLGGRTILAEDLQRLAIFQSEKSAKQFDGMAVANARGGVRQWFFGEPDVKDVTDELITTPSVSLVPRNADAIGLLCARFHLIAKQLRDRRAGRSTLDISDEYDVQDLMHALLWIFFDDVRKEVWTPTYAGRSSRVDFLLPTEQIVVETKKTRVTLGAKELGDELLVDIAHYKEFPSCKRLICFVYDPEERIVNPRGLERDLSRKETSFEVKTIIVPRSA